MIVDGYATGILVTSHQGRPTKIEGNPEHPASLGATGVFERAHVLGLYDPTARAGFRRDDGPATFDGFARAFSQVRPDRGRGLRFLMQPTSSPLLQELLQRVRDRAPEARFTFYSPLASSSREEGAEIAFGARLQPLYAFDAARVVVAVDSDFLASGPFSARYARDFAARPLATPPAT